MISTTRTKMLLTFPIPAYSLFDAGMFVSAKKEWNKLSVSGGIRYDLRHIQWNDFYTQTNPNNGFQQQVKAPIQLAHVTLFPQQAVVYRSIGKCRIYL